jgi:hypothetical protein
MPAMALGRHFFWSNFVITKTEEYKPHSGNLTHNTVSDLGKGHGIELPSGTKDQRRLLRNAVDPRLGQHILKAALKETKQESLL